MSCHPDDAHAQVIDSILSLAKGSPESHAAYCDYQTTRMAIHPLLLRQRVLLTRATMQPGCSYDEVRRVLVTPSPIAAWPVNPELARIDAQVAALDAEIAALWMALDSRVWQRVAA